MMHSGQGYIWKLLITPTLSLVNLLFPLSLSSSGDSFLGKNIMYKATEWDNIQKLLQAWDQLSTVAMSNMDDVFNVSNEFNGESIYKLLTFQQLMKLVNLWMPHLMILITAIMIAILKNELNSKFIENIIKEYVKKSWWWNSGITCQETSDDSRTVDHVKKKRKNN